MASLNISSEYTKKNGIQEPASTGSNTFSIILERGYIILKIFMVGALTIDFTGCSKLLSERKVVINFNY